MATVCLALSLPLPIVSTPIHILCPITNFLEFSPLCNGSFPLAWFLQIPKVKPTNLKDVSLCIWVISLCIICSSSIHSLQIPGATVKIRLRKIHPWCNCGIIVKEVTTGFLPGFKAYYMRWSPYLIKTLRLDRSGS